MVDKYTTIFWTQIKNMFEYRINIMLKLVRPILMTVVIGSLWVVLFSVSDRETLGGFTLSSFIVYLLIIRFIATFSPGTKAIMDMNKEITTGDFTIRLVRPVHYLKWVFFRSLPMPLFSGTIGLVVVSILAIVFDIAFPQGWFIVLFAISVLATIVIQYAMYQGLGILSFWMYNIWPFQRFIMTLRQILSGEMIPLTFFGSVGTALLYLPFASVAFIPGGIYIGLFSLQEAIWYIVIQYVWAVVLWLLVIYAFNKGVRAFEAQGG